MKYYSDELTVKNVSLWIVQNRNQSLWDLMGEEHQSQLLKLRQMGIKFDWFTSDWLIKATKGDFPALASLFLSWTKGRNWLDKQINLLKQNIESESIS